MLGYSVVTCLPAVHKRDDLRLFACFLISPRLKAGFYNLMLAIIIAVVIVLAMNLVGSLLISALVIFPAVSAMCIFKNFRSVTICAAVLSVTCAAIGILVSVLAGTPVGSTIVAVQIFVFFVFRISGKLAGGRVA